MTDTTNSQNTDLSSWIILYVTNEQCSYLSHDMPQGFNLEAGFAAVTAADYDYDDDNDDDEEEEEDKLTFIAWVWDFRSDPVGWRG